MNRYFRAAGAALILAGGLGSAGCACRGGGAGDGAHGRWIDPSWPERYNYSARQAVIAPFAQQVANGHFTNQVVWNWYFEPGTDKLNGAGMEKLDSIARTTPNPDTKLFIQAPRDVAVTPENIARVNALRDDLTAKRAAAVARYMATQPGPAVVYDISVVDMPTPGIYAPFATNAFRGMQRGYVGSMKGGSGAQVGGGGTSAQAVPPATVNVVQPGATGAGTGDLGTGGSGPGY